MTKETGREAFGPNIWLVDEMYRQYQEDPDAVGQSWREFFEDYKPGATKQGNSKQRSTEQDNRDAGGPSPSGATPTDQRADETHGVRKSSKSASDMGA
ncbi:MAG TPA: hypothetical protein VEV82_06970, partial [Actinomycetota bacterium]|nr:hypothetical protein [Actinomycetota bacterium]